MVIDHWWTGTIYITVRIKWPFCQFSDQLHSSRWIFTLMYMLWQKLCIKMTSMNHGWWVNYYKKCYDLWHIWVSINQNIDLNWFQLEKGKVSGVLVILRKKLWNSLSISILPIQSQCTLLTSSTHSISHPIPSQHINWKW